MKVVDASVAFKWLVDETGTEAALEIARSNDLIAPDLLWSEVANGLWRKTMQGDIDGQSALSVMPILDRMIGERVASPDLMHNALDLAISLGHPVYDCVYLALARQRGIALVSADERLIGKVRASGLTVAVETL
ncbi:MAG: type II toxin-antitoxin system VapC family toxin [Sphingopyxis sp.]|nr:type II toxin-antitoxin system VapC family toxin [Sphingopyxis sp.]